MKLVVWPYYPSVGKEDPLKDKTIPRDLRGNMRGKK